MTSPPAPRPMYLEEFTPLVGQTMQADCKPQSVPLQLIEARPLANHAKLERSPFILIFQSATEALLVSGTYTLKASGFGPDQVHLIQIARPLSAESGHYYQAIFN